jgi:flagellar hook-associated protein 3 FlgL
MQISTNSYFRQSTDNFQELKTQAAKLQEQIATGKKITAASDDPVSFSDLALLKARDVRLAQYKRNIDNARQTLTLEDSALQQASNLLTRVKELAIQGSNDSLSPADRQLVAIEVRGLEDSLLQIANTQDSNGLPVFGGFSSGRPFERMIDGSIQYTKGDANKTQQQVGDDAFVTVGFSGHEVFNRVPMGNGPSKSVFDIVKAVGDALGDGKTPLTPNDDIAKALDHIISQQAEVGSRLSLLDNAEQKLQDDQTATTAQISTLQDTVIEKAVTELQKKLTTLDAAQTSFVKIAQLSLFNYLK